MFVALFGITNDALNLVVNLLILFLVVLWLALIAWTFFDARRRIEDGVLVACATAASLFPFVGTIVYSILRPPEFLADRRERELEMRASELRVRQLEESSCPNCEHPIERNYLRCPSCRARIKDPCESCGKPIDPRWSVCPYCETPIRRAAPPERRVQPKRRGKPSREPAPRGSEPPPTRARTATKRSSSRSSAATRSSEAPPRKAESSKATDGEPTRKAPAKQAASRQTRQAQRPDAPGRGPKRAE
jgi:hypothetical protein